MFLIPQQPIDRLPVELLMMIFEYAGSDTDNPDSEKFLLEFGVSTAWIISRVCRRWRDVAAIAEVEIVVITDVARVSIFQDAEGSYVVFDALGKPSSRAGGKCRSFERVFSSIITDCEKWHILDIEAEPNFLSRLEPLRGRIDALRSLDIRSSLNLSDSDYSFLSSFTLFSTLPRLESIYGSPALLLALPLPLDQITELEIVENCPSCPPLTVLSLLQRLPNLAECRLFYQYYADAMNNPGEVQLHALTLHKVTTFTISFFAYSFLKVLTLPCLSSLELTTDAVYDPRRIGSSNPYRYEEHYIKDFLLRSRSPACLTHVKVVLFKEVPEVEVVKLANVLKLAPKLRHLELELSVPYNHTVRSLNRALRDTPPQDFLPHLCEVDIEVDHLDKRAFRAYDAMVDRIEKIRLYIEFSLEESED